MKSELTNSTIFQYSEMFGVAFIEINKYARNSEVQHDCKIAIVCNEETYSLVFAVTVPINST